MDKYFKKGEIIRGYSILNVIGQGRYGIAYLAVNSRGEKCVVKQLKKDMLKESREKLIYEESILKALDLPQFPKFIGKFKDKNREGYILEYIEGKVLYDWLSDEGYRFSKAEIYEFAGKIIDLVETLHNNNIVHRDIRLPNLILKENNELVLIDFGLARYLDGDRYVKDIDYWYVADSLLHLYYSTYDDEGTEEKPWYDELDLTYHEKHFLKKLMGLDGKYKNIEEIRVDLEGLKSRLNDAKK